MSSPLARLLQQAEKHLRSGDLQAAQAACEQALRKAPRHPDVLALGGGVRLALGHPEQAVSLLEQVIRIEPRHGAALEHLGLAFLMLARYGDAEKVLARAAAMNGAPASVHMRLGIAILEQARPRDALPALLRATSAAPGDADALIHLGRAHAALGDTAQAGIAFESALRAAPDRPEPALNLGVLALQAGDLAQAARWFERSLAADPGYVDAALHLGIVFQREQRFDQALATLRRAQAMDAGNASVAVEIGRTLLLAGNRSAARDQFQRAVGQAPEYAAAHEGLASACLGLGRIAEAIDHLRATLRLEPMHGPACAALGNALFQRGELDEARTTIERSLSMEGDHGPAFGTLANIHIARNELQAAIDVLESGCARTHNSHLLGMLAYLLRQACDWDRWRTLWPRVESLMRSGSPIGSPFWLLCEPVDNAALLEYTRRWADTRFGPILERPARPKDAGTSPRHRRLRIGYLSSDLHEHATAYLVADVFEQHDRERFEVFAYSCGPDDGSPMRRRLQVAIEHFIDIAQVPDDAAADRIRQDDLDLLVDLKGYTLGDRLTILARRPCSLQATWLGYPGTTAVSFIDHVVADPMVIPNEAERFFTEHVARMPACYQPNDRKRIVAEPLDRAAYGLPPDAWVFCCFNQSYKFTPEVFGAWMELLQRVEGSVLWLLTSNALADANLAAHARRAGVDPARIVFAPRLRNADHLARYRVADLALDTFPYTSHTTMSDALWCGCPAIGLRGDTFAARVSSSLLAAADLHDLIVDSLDAYEQLARRIAGDPAFRAAIRERVAQAQSKSRLFDSLRFTQDLEALYEQMIREQ